MPSTVDNAGPLLIDPNGYIYLGGKNAANGLKLDGLAFASLPTAALGSGCFFKVTNVGPSGFGSIWISNGTRWSPLGGRVTLAQLGAATSAIANVETIQLQALIPAGAWQVNDTVRVNATLIKSGTTDTANLSIRCGTAGTTADTALVSASASLAGANRTGGLSIDHTLASATTAQRVGNQGVLGSWSQASASALPAAVTISSAATNSLYITVTIASSSTNDTVGVTSASIELLTP